MRDESYTSYCTSLKQRSFGHQLYRCMRAYICSIFMLYGLLHVPAAPAFLLPICSLQHVHD